MLNIPTHLQIRGETASVDLHGIDKVISGERYSSYNNPAEISNPETIKENHLCGFWLPDFQRPEVWTENQKIRFMESVFLRYDIGVFIYVNAYGHKYDGCLIDGQQRLTALRDYILNKFPVFGAYFNELTDKERRGYIYSANFRAIRINDQDAKEEVLRDLYNRLNFGGTAHTEDQKA